MRRLLVRNGFPDPLELVELRFQDEAEWITVHESRKERARRQVDRERAVRRGLRFRICFAEKVSGPICLGHSSHFGMGLFLPEAEGENAEASR
jgi:CRISPR-associated protein Csb2